MALTQAEMQLMAEMKDTDPLKETAPASYDNEAPFTAQIGRGMMDVYQGGKQLGLNALAAAMPDTFGGDAEDYNRMLTQELATYNKNNPNFQIGRLAGNIATPLSLVPGAGGTGALARTATTALTSGAMGAIQPTMTDDGDFWGGKAEQALIGAVMGPLTAGGVKLTGKGLQAIRKVIRPFSQKGITNDIKDFLMDELGEEQAPKVIAALRRAKEYLPGNKPTSGQAVADANLGVADEIGAPLMRLEKDLAKKASSRGIAQTNKAQQVARDKVLSDIAGTPADMAAAKSTRYAKTRPHYKAVEESRNVVDAVPLFQEIDDILAKHPNEPRITVPLREIRERMIKGIGDDGIIDVEGNPQALRSLSKNIKDKLKAAAKGDEDFDVKTLGEIKDSLDTMISKGEPEYGVAQSLYKQYSKPIDKMKVGKELQDRLTPYADAEKAPGFLNAIRDEQKLVKKATGFGRNNGLKGTLNVEESANVKSVARELERNQKMNQLGAGSNIEPVLPKLEKMIEPTIPNLLSRPALIANAVLSRIGKSKSPEYNKVLNELMHEPQKLADLLEMPAESPLGRLAREIAMEASTKGSAMTFGRERGKN